MRIRVGIIGCGAMTMETYVPTLRSLSELYVVEAVADPSAERRDSVADALGIPQGSRFESAHELLALEQVESVLIVTPPQARAELAVAAARAGKNVLCEKPIATRPVDAARVLAMAAEQNVCLGVVHNYLWFPEYVAAREVIDSGEIGDVEVVEINALGVWDNPGASGNSYNWRHDPAVAGGGVLMDMLHLVYLAEHLSGRPFDTVSSYVDSHRPGSLVETVALCRFETGHGVALVNVGWGLGAGGATVSGSKGRIEIRYENGGTSPFAPLETISVVTAEGRRVVPVAAPREALQDVLTDFADSIVAGRAPTADGNAGLRALEAAVGAYSSAAQGQSVRLPLEPDDPVYVHGVAGLSEVVTPSWSPVARKKLFR